MLVHGSPGQAVVAETSGETLLARAVVVTVWRDLRSSRAPLRAEAEAWVQDLGALALWAEALGLAPEVLQAALRRAARPA